MTARCIALSHFGGIQALPLAHALSDLGLLAHFFTGMYVEAGAAASLLSKFAPKLAGYCGRIDKRSVSVVPWPFLMHKAAARFTSSANASAGAQRAFTQHDEAVARLLRGKDFDLFVGYELSSALSFQAAKERGALCVLEASSMHHSYQERALKGTPEIKNLQRTIVRKDREIESADYLVVLSSIAKESYRLAGVPSERIEVIPPFVDTTEFASHSVTPRRSKGISYLFVGNQSFHKGLDLLFEAFESLTIPGKQLRVIGGQHDSSVISSDPNIEVLPRIARGRLVEHFQWADVVVLPSRFDGYGFVVIEALASGKPAIVSSAVGAADLIEDGLNGWVFPTGDVGELARKMKMAWQMRDRLDSMRCAARDAVEKVSFTKYLERVGHFYSGDRVSKRTANGLSKHPSN